MAPSLDKLAVELLEGIAQHVPDLTPLSLVNRECASKFHREYQMKHFKRISLNYSDERQLRQCIKIADRNGLMKFSKVVKISIHRGWPARAERYMRLLITLFRKLKTMGVNLEELVIASRVPRASTLGRPTHQAWFYLKSVHAMHASGLTVMGLRIFPALPIHEVYSDMQLSQVFSDTINTITSLYVEGWTADTGGDASVAEKFVETLTASPTLRHLAIRDHYFKKHDVGQDLSDSLLKALLAAQLPALTSLHIQGDRLSLSLIALVTFSRRHSCLKTLRIDGIADWDNSDEDSLDSAFDPSDGAAKTIEQLTGIGKVEVDDYSEENWKEFWV